MQGWRINMEDAHISNEKLTNECALFGVFDGHGGREVAKFVERHYCDELLKNPNFKNGKYEIALTESFLRMDELMQSEDGKRKLQAIRSEVKDSENNEYGNGTDESCAGCTANVALLTKDTLYVANAGDSRCVISVKGKAVEMSYDHKPDNEEERMRINKAGG